MLARLLLFIFAVTFLPIGIIFGAIGLLADDVDRGEPEAFAYLGAVFTAVGLVLAVAFGVLQRREFARRRRRRAGLRTTAEVVGVHLNTNVHSGAKVSTNLTGGSPATPCRRRSSRSRTPMRRERRSRLSTTRRSRPTSSRPRRVDDGAVSGDEVPARYRQAAAARRVRRL